MMIRRLPLRSWPALLGLLLLAAAGCGEDGQSGAPEASATSAGDPTAGSLEQPGPDDGVPGRVINRSDTPDVPDRPVEQGWVLAVPADALPQLWQAGGLDPEGPPQPRRMEVTVAAQDLPAGTVTAPVGADGRFVLVRPAGPSVVCLANNLPDDPPGPPYLITGCTPPLEIGGELLVSTGLGGVMTE